LQEGVSILDIRRCSGELPALHWKIDGGSDSDDGGDEYGGINSYIVFYVW